MPEVAVTGVGLVSALGETTAAWHSLLAGHSAIALRQPFAPLPPLPLAMLGKAPAAVDWLVEQAVQAALEEAHLSPPLPACGIVLGSSRSYLQQWEQLAQQPPQADDWIRALPHQAALGVARQVGSQGPVLAPMAACATGIWALAQGYELIRTGQCDRVIAGAVEAPVTPLTLAGFAKMGALAHSGCYPFDLDREGLVLGEGAAVVVLERLPVTARPAYGTVRGFGLLNDAFHMSRPQGKSAIAAVRQGLARSQVRPDQIDYVHTHGTATQLNDQMEADLVSAMFPQAAVSSTKGATGHTLGASGALGAVFSLMALKYQLLPPCVGLTNPAFELNWVRQARAATVEHVCCCSFGFGGQAAVAIFGR
ncbi:MAG: beta-ketoacyl-ACP synthase [Leptolyngbya sp. SIO4C1]|nr:beta-ketoacyl-ACP synthase [Leptolyngbya sp. SIO4C1]